MAENRKPKPDDAAQSQRFIETAEALEADKNVKAFERSLEVVIKPKPMATKESQKRRPYGLEYL